jgi:hypothetical protein
MTTVFQIVVVLVIAVAAFFLFRGRGARHQALRRLAMLLFIAAAASSVFFPQIWTIAANFIGIGRGTDLLLYFLVLIFIGYVATTYRRFRQIERELTELSRQLALLSAVAPERSDH